MTGPTIAVVPDASFASRARLWAALERAYGVRFVAATALRGKRPAARVTLAPGAEEREEAVPQLLVRTGTARAAVGAELVLGSSLGRPLAGQRLPDVRASGQAALALSPGDQVLASRGGVPVWIRRPGRGGSRDLVTLPPDELPLGGALRDQLRPGRAIGLLPLVELLRRVTADDGWERPPLRAAFLFDDPNLHRARYGYLDFPALAAHARAHGYHVAMATVPLDAWHVHPRAAAAFRRSPERLSLVIHGVDHAERELERHDGEEAATVAVARALRGAAALERRSGVAVGRLMVPPHHACGPAVTRALAQAGFDALCQVDGRGRGADPELDGWGLAAVAPGGLPVITRLQLPSRSDGSVAAGIKGVGPGLVLNAYLGRPLVIYGHHYDAAPDLAPLAETTAFVDALGPVSWLSLPQIAERNRSTRRDGDTLLVRPASRRVRIEVPAGVRWVVVDPAGLEPGETVVSRGADVSLRGRPGEPLALGPGVVELRLQRPQPAPHAPGRAGRRPRRAVIRRAASETRDRLMPALDRLRGTTPTATRRSPS